MPLLLAIIPHPDDESYSFAGTFALLTEAGWGVVVHCASAGEMGERHDGGATDPASVGLAREAELRRSCDYLGAEAPFCWQLPDGGLREYPSQSSRIQSLLRGLRPDVVLTLGADGVYGHPDHVAVHRWVAEGWAGLEGPRPPLLFAAFQPGLFLPQYEKCISMMGEPPDPPATAIGASTGDLEVDVTSVRGRKLAAISSHRTQLPEGDPYALFPPGVLAACLDVERFTLAEGSPPPPASFFQALQATRSPSPPAPQSAGLFD
jgi:LmbE family N-acetylglucosaminyl deacetylase